MGCHVVETASGKLAFRFRWQQRDGRRRYFSATTEYTDREQAVKKATIIGAEIRAGEFEPSRHFELPPPRFGLESRKPSKPMLAADEIETWIDRKELRGVRKSRIRDYRSHLENYFRTYEGDPLYDLEAFQLWLVQRVSEKTARNVIRGTLRAFVRDQRGDLTSFDRLTWERYTPSRRQEPFTSSERERILGWFQTRRPFPEYVSLRLRFLGLRPSEVRGFQVGDFDRSMGTIEVRRSRHLGSDAAPKTVAAERVVELDALTAAAIATVAGIREPAEYLVNVAEDTLRDNFTKAQKALGIRPRALYQTKHTKAVRGLRDGENPSDVADQLGISLATLEKYYTAALRTRPRKTEIAPSAPRIAPRRRES